MPLQASILLHGIIHTRKLAAQAFAAAAAPYCVRLALLTASQNALASKHFASWYNRGVKFCYVAARGTLPCLRTVTEQTEYKMQPNGGDMDMKNRAGELVTNLSGEMAYKSFKPNPLPPIPPVEQDNEMVEYLVKANKRISEIESAAKRIPSVKLFISMYVRKEALLSSQIEGTQCTLDDVLNPIMTENANRDVSDVINYVKASEFAVERLKTLPLCVRFIKETHAVLLSDSRGSEKNPGELRSSQNWIGAGGSTLQNARYIPPNTEDMKTAMQDLENFIHADSDLDVLICAALIHYQFETIHPFLDGNGRVGRLLITLYLMEKNVLSTPILYPSYFLKKNRIEYYDRMTEVRRKGNYEQWIKFFLTALYDAATDALNTIDKLIELHDRTAEKIEAFGKTRNSAQKLMAYLEKNPIMEIGKTARELGMAYNTVSRIVNLLTDRHILVCSGKTGKTKIYSYEEYLKILRKDTE